MVPAPAAAASRGHKPLHARYMDVLLDVTFTGESQGKLQKISNCITYEPTDIVTFGIRQSWSLASTEPVLVENDGGYLSFSTSARGELSRHETHTGGRGRGRRWPSQPRGGATRRRSPTSST